VAHSTTYTHYVDDEVAPSTTIDQPVIDSAAYDHWIGVEVNTPLTGVQGYDGYFKGYIFGFCVTSSDLINVDDERTDDAGCVQPHLCSSCPLKPDEVCLIECDYDQFYDEEANSCTSCALECGDGCVREENCHPCIDAECDVCPGFDDCDVCTTNATKNADGDCECDEGYFFDYDDIKCESCHSECRTCTGATSLDCTGCKDGFFKQKDANICLPHCPNGFKENSDNECEEDTTEIFCATFDI